MGHNRLLFSQKSLLVFWLFASLFCIGMVNAQSGLTRVRGHVSTQRGEPLVGATVTQVGTNNATSTDDKGAYSIMVGSGNVSLEFSMIGYKTTVVKVDKNGVVDVVMQEELTENEEVVVVGYGTMKKRDLTGSISKIKQEAFTDQPMNTVAEALQGRAAGVLVGSSGGPGGIVDIKIRGASSINASVEPLYVIDGIPMEQNNIAASDFDDKSGGINVLSTINPSDIESIEILKDASATAIYGSRGSNGVVLITTKEGQRGKLKINVDYYYGLKKAAKTYDLMDAGEYIQLLNAYGKAKNADNTYSPFYYGQGYNTDWQNEMLKTAQIHNTNINLSGGTDALRYNISGNYFHNEGVFLNSFLNRGSVRFNLDFKLSPKVKLGTKITLSEQQSANTDAQGVQKGVNMRYAVEASPTYPVKDEDGFYTSTNYLSGQDTYNPVAALTGIEYDNKTYRVLSNVYFEYKLLPWISYRLNTGYDVMEYKRANYQSSQALKGVAYRGMAYTKSYDNVNWIVTNQLTFNPKFKGEHSLNGVLAYEASKRSGKEIYAYNDNFFSDKFGLNNIGLGLNPKVSSGSYESSMLSYLGRVNYTFRNEYLFTGSFRYDGASKFGKDYKWGIFPSVAFAWRLSNNKWVKSLDVFDDLKFRISYGVVGNQRIGDYQSLAAADITFYGVPDWVNAIVLNRLGNSELRWEKSRQFDAGIDMAFLKNRLRFTFDYYRKNTNDLLLKSAIPSSSGFKELLQNQGGMRITGYEFSLESKNIVGNFNWSTGLNISFDRGIVTNMAGNPPLSIFGNWNIAGGSSTSDVIAIIKEGDRLNNFYGYVAAGTIQYGDREKLENRHLIAQQQYPGGTYFLDLNNDGVLNSNDLAVIGNANPDFYYGFSNDFNYKNFSLNIFFQGVYGNEMMLTLNKKLYSLTPLSNVKSGTLESRWSNDNPTNAYQSFGRDTRMSTQMLEDASYLRLKTVTAGYDINKGFLKYFKGAKFYITASNLLTITKYGGLDPAYSDTDNLVKGFDDGYYPLERSIIFGLRASF
ncbi:MAG: SusC/RagA family TonB-linked outer membrane protein [Niabella sp.]